MKMKKLTALASATLLASLLTLTSCSEGEKTPEAENVGFANYATEISIEAFQKAHDKYATTLNVEAGYDYTTYDFTSNIITTKESETSSVSYEKNEKKYDKANTIIVQNSEDFSYYNVNDAKEAIDTQTATIKYDTQIQKNGEKADFINTNSKTYYTNDFVVSAYSMQSINLSNVIDTLTGSVAEGDTTKTLKYYGDNNVYTLKVTINTTDEHEESGIKFKETVSSETVFQFYVSDKEAYGKYTFDKTTTLDYTDGDQTGTITKKAKKVKYATLKIGALTLSKIDTSTYQKSTY